MNPLLIGLLVLAVILYFWYATIIMRRNKVLESLSGIDVQLNKRHDLIPNILTIAQKYMEHERGLLEDITELRNQAYLTVGSRGAADVAEHLELETMLAARMGKFFAVAENYPELKSNETMVQAQQTYNEVEEHIAAARRFYNAAATALNNAIQTFPGNILAGFMKIIPYPYFETQEKVREPVNAGDYLKSTKPE